METRRQGLSLVTAISLFIGTLVVIQLWLLAAALDALLSGVSGVLIPAAIASFVLFLLNVGLLWHVRNFDERERRMHGHG
jgi:uncharacterized protein DUF6755